MACSRPSTGVRGRMTCPVCMEHYDTEAHLPRTLPCQHTVCHACLTQLCSNKTTIQSPVERSSHMIPPSGLFPINFTARDVAEELQKQLMCEEHKNKVCGLVCINCLVPLCFNCLKNQKHGLHRMESPQDAKPVLRDKLCEQQTDHIKKKLKIYKDMLKEVSEAENHITRTYNDITDILKKWKKEEHSKITTIKKRVEVQVAELEKEEGLIRISSNEKNTGIPALLLQLKQIGTSRNMRVSLPQCKYDATSAISKMEKCITQCLTTVKKNVVENMIVFYD